jgi:putative phosphoesterase
LDRVAVISDVHGNIWALQAVLDDVRRRGVEHIINLGDTVYGPLEPQATADFLMLLDICSIQGNEDRILASDPAPSPTLEYVLKTLTPHSREWLASQPATSVVEGELYLCHGTPRSDKTYLLESMSVQGGFLNEPQSIESQLDSVSQAVILCGHSHVPRTVCLPDGRLIVNPGSVGLPAYADDAPVAHKMENGSPHARYAVLARARAGWMVEQIALPYEWDKAADAARRNGRQDWAAWLSSGRA